MRFRIKPGYSFRDSDNSVKAGGDTIELDDEAATRHAEKIEPIADAATVQSSASAADDHDA